MVVERVPGLKECPPQLNGLTRLFDPAPAREKAVADRSLVFE